MVEICHPCSSCETGLTEDTFDDLFELPSCNSRDEKLVNVQEIFNCSTCSWKKEILLELSKAKVQDLEYFMDTNVVGKYRCKLGEISYLPEFNTSDNTSDLLGPKLRNSALYVRLDNQSIERDRLIGIGFVLNFVKFISFTFGDKEMISVIEAVSR
ncbi:hypothetical protein Tco_0167738 [Tanacetum coccineum]